MQKLVIKSQFMGVKPCEIELRRFLLLIGEQASGKSTIAKLIYFFQTLPEEIYTIVKIQNESSRNSLFGEIPLTYSGAEGIAERNFEMLFKSFFMKKPFEIYYYYDDTSFVKVSKDNRVSFEKDLREKLDALLSAIIPQKESEQIKNIRLRDEIRSIFHIQNTDFNYVAAGRSTATAFPIIESAISEINKRIGADSEKGQDLEIRRRSGSELLLAKFVQWAEKVRDVFRVNGGTFQTLLTTLENEGDKIAMGEIKRIASKVLKGEYSSNWHGESIVIEGETAVPLNDASSGQQEVLRILQGLFLAVGLKNRREFFVVEEPEAHLYPLAQKELIHAFAVFLNAIKEGRLIITTHSPYILACVNILLLAHFVNKERGGNGIEKQISETAVPKDYWLDPADFTAYAIGHSNIYCRNIKDDVTGLVAENYLDSISDVLGMQYNQLYNLLTLEGT